jgi:hypothetical protein
MLERSESADDNLNIRMLERSERADADLGISLGGTGRLNPRVLVFGHRAPEVLRLRRPVVVGALVIGLAAGCGSADPSSNSAEPLAHSSSAIQGGTADTTHNFAVGIVQHSSQTVAVCSGVLLAPNLVATARHCVSQLTAQAIDCATSMFTGTVPASSLLVTASPTIMPRTSVFAGVSNIIIPTDATASNVCGHDIALLILSSNIQLPQYVTPAINPPMTDHRAYSTAVTAIGYGVSTPTDTSGTSAGVRRIKENVRLVCIPNDKIFVDCFSYPNARQFIDPKEFEGGDGTCEGDSGSGAFDQGSFANGKWVAFGVLSRGGGTPEGGTCIGSLYTRFDAWSQLLVDAAGQAAAMGGYSPPSWTGLPAQAPPDAGPSVIDGSPNPPTESGVATACQTNGTVCGADGDCCSMNCVSHDNNQTYACLPCDDNSPCVDGYVCHQGVCVVGVPSVDAGAADAAGALNPTARAGCAVSPVEQGETLPWRASAGLLAIAAMALARRRSCRNSDSLSFRGDS